MANKPAEKMFNIISHRENVNHCHVGMSSTPTDVCYDQNKEKKSADEDVEK